jgi:hypothetical protein
MALAKKLFQQLPEHSVVMTDAGFGIFAVAHPASCAGHSFVFRLPRQRFNTSQKRAKRIASGERSKSYQFPWTPSEKDWAKHTEIPAIATLQVWLHEMVIRKDWTLLLVSDLPASADSCPARDR